VKLPDLSAAGLLLLFGLLPGILLPWNPAALWQSV